MTMIMINYMKTNTYATDCITQNKVSTLNIFLVRLAGYIASLIALATNKVYSRGGGSHMKGVGMLIVSFRVVREEIYKNYILSIRFIYSIHAI